MGATTRRTVLLAIAVGLLVVGSATMALAQYPPGQAFSVSVFPENPQPGDTVTATVVGAQAGESLDWEAVSTRVLASGSVVADAQGEAQFTFEVPADAPVGERISVNVTGSISGSADAGVVTVSDGEAGEPGEDADAEDAQDPAEVVEAGDDAAAPAGELSRTGLETAMYVAVALALIGLGAAAIVGARRRERSRIEA